MNLFNVKTRSGKFIFFCFNLLFIYPLTISFPLMVIAFILILKQSPSEAETFHSSLVLFFDFFGHPFQLSFTNEIIVIVALMIFVLFFSFNWLMLKNVAKKKNYYFFILFLFFASILCIFLDGGGIDVF